MSLLSRTHDLVGPERGSCSACYTSNATFREDSVGRKQDMAGRVGGWERCIWRGPWEKASSVSPLMARSGVSSVFLSLAPSSGLARGGCWECTSRLHSKRQALWDRR